MKNNLDNTQINHMKEKATLFVFVRFHPIIEWHFGRYAVRARRAHFIFVLTSTAILQSRQCVQFSTVLEETEFFTYSIYPYHSRRTASAETFGRTCD